MTAVIISFADARKEKTAQVAPPSDEQQTPLAILERIAIKLGIPLEDELPLTAPRPRRPRR